MQLLQAFPLCGEKNKNDKRPYQLTIQTTLRQWSQLLIPNPLNKIIEFKESQQRHKKTGKIN